MFDNYDDLLEERKQKYLNENIKIISSNMKNKVNPNNLFYVEKLAEISLVIDEKLKIKNITDRQKELIVEGTFSAYEYLNEKHNKAFDEFKEHLSTYLKKIKISHFLLTTENGMYLPSKKILLNKSFLKDSDESFDKKFLLTYTHELCHCLSNDNENETCGLMKVEYKYRNFLNKTYQDYKYSDEMQTESSTQEMLKKNFPEFIKQNECFEDNFADKENAKIKINSVGYVYYELIPYIKSINHLYNNLFENMYLTRAPKINEIDDKDLSEMCKSLSESYINYRDIKHNNNTMDNYFKLEDSFVNIVEHYLNNNELSNEEYFKITDKLLENPRIIQINKEIEININETSVALLDLQRFNKNINNNISRDDVISMFIELNEPRGSAYSYKDKDNEDKQLYDFLKDMRAVRNNELSISDFKEKYEEKDFEMEL